jgi:hypothetical protein
MAQDGCAPKTLLQSPSLPSTDVARDIRFIKMEVIPDSSVYQYQFVGLQYKWKRVTGSQ